MFVLLVLFGLFVLLLLYGTHYGFVFGVERAMYLHTYEYMYERTDVLRN